jgi:transposase
MGSSEDALYTNEFVQSRSNLIASNAAADAPDNGSAGSLHPRLAWMMCYNETRSAQAVCDKFGISRKTFYKWLKRYRETNSDTSSLTDRSRRPHRFPRATPESQIQILKMAKAQTGYGQRRLRAYLEEKYNISLSERTIWKILKREGHAPPPTK